MYWAKKILAWHKEGPERALQMGFRLASRYSLDGADPNGYVGSMWSMCGVHDHEGQERPVFGKIRCMSLADCEREFDVAAFVRFVLIVWAIACKETMKIPSNSSRDELLKWLNRINSNREKNCGKSVANYPFAACRIRRVGGKNEFKSVRGKNLDDFPEESGLQKGCIVYWMNRDQRIQDNWALLFAQRIALKFSVSLHVCFNLASSPALRTRRHANFLLEGLMEVEKECKDLNIGFHLLSLPATKFSSSKGCSADGDAKCQVFDTKKMEPIVDLLNRLDARVVVTDFSPLRDDLQGVKFVSSRLPQDIPLYQVDAHNVVPAWIASEKLEYSARTIRRKLNDKAKYLFTDFPPVICHPGLSKSVKVDWEAINGSLVGLVDESVGPVTWAEGGCKAGLSQLFSFSRHRLRFYAKSRNDPTKRALSNLSPWLHFGHISAQRCLWEVKQLHSEYKESVDAFMEEAFVRRELADNFCYYNPNYDSIKGAWPWAQETLRKHANDVREPSYSEEEMEFASTGDELWNAAQRQLLREGKMHGFLRMYWAKKILEWHAEGSEKALHFGIYLHNRYSLDGADPNAYVGVMWSICGVHDQGWRERPVFGKIRYMNFAGCKRKFDVAAFIKRYPK
ncbi:Deoxyribodipyrimidine photo-lyase [Taenia crassiceps]|uniref:Deoxyribodipyrimidine photo-lyase n=1 Tax=Taenia crassiceps TaxID=6207 RepID=A0ABR4QH30_9CEST